MGVGGQAMLDPVNELLLVSGKVAPGGGCVFACWHEAPLRKLANVY